MITATASPPCTTTGLIQCYCTDVVRGVKADQARPAGGVAAQASSRAARAEPRNRRSAQVAATRRRIIDAAANLFTERGYAGTSIEAIAAQADVAVETVYARFGNKRQLLSDFLDVTIAGDHLPVPILDRDLAQNILRSTDQGEQIRLMGRLDREILSRIASAIRMLRGAASSDAAIAAIAETLDAHRRTAQRTFLVAVMHNGPLRPGLNEGAAADGYSAISSPDTFWFLTQQCGWTPEAFEEWLVQTLTLLLLPTVTTD